MEISEFARSILLSDQLTDKLFSPLEFTDHEPITCNFHLDRPARSKAWDFRETPGGAAFPKADALAHNPDLAGAVFHFFANHELLALELMAWLLIKRPDLPSSLRLGLASTMVEEQNHMRLYLEQMSKRGVQLGDYGMGSRFWKILSQDDDPRKFLAGMSLTFEQANLDFAREWRDRFNNLGLESEAMAMDTVYREEIGHVKHGLVWLRKLDDQNLDDLRLHQVHLPYPLSLRNAKGHIYDRDARLAAGLDEQYIESLWSAGGSASRSPDLFYYQVAPEARTKESNTQLAQVLEQDCASLAALDAAEEDFVLVENLPSQEFQLKWKSIWGHNPCWMTMTTLQIRLAKGQKMRNLHVWGWGTQELHLAAMVDKSPQNLSTEQIQFWWSKTRSAQVQSQLPAVDPCWDLEVGQICTHFDQLLLTLQGDREYMIKPNLTASAHGRWIGNHAKAITQKDFLTQLVSQDPVIVEPRRPKERDYSLLFQIEEQGPRFVGITLFETDLRGTWRGTWVNEPFLVLPAQETRWWRESQDNESRLDRWIRIATEHIAQQLWAEGFRGPMGVDGMTWIDSDGQRRLRPCVEVNARRTFGHLALRLRKKLAPRTLGALYLERLTNLQPSGYKSFTAWDDSLPKPQLDSQDRWTHGTATLSDTALAHNMVPTFIVGEDLKKSAWLQRAQGPFKV